jgi:hypothetical protein
MSPPAASRKATASAATAKLALVGMSPSGTLTPSNAKSEKPAPDEVVKKTIDNAGRMFYPGERLFEGLMLTEISDRW